MLKNQKQKRFDRLKWDTKECEKIWLRIFILLVFLSISKYFYLISIFILLVSIFILLVSQPLPLSPFTLLREACQPQGHLSPSTNDSFPGSWKEGALLYLKDPSDHHREHSSWSLYSLIPFFPFCWYWQAVTLKTITDF